MWVEQWSADLRQGDVLGPIIFPSLGKTITTTAEGGSLVAPAQAVASVLVPAEPKLVVVVSHDCEFNEGKRNKMLVARIENVPGHYTPEVRDELRGSNDVEEWLKDHATLAGVDAFVLQPVAGAFEEEQVVAFTSITPLPMKLKNELQGVKRAEMDDAARVLFRRKLAWFFGRSSEDVLAGPERAAV